MQTAAAEYDGSECAGGWLKVDLNAGGGGGGGRGGGRGGDRGGRVAGSAAGAVASAVAAGVVALATGVAGAAAVGSAAVAVTEVRIKAVGNWASIIMACLYASTCIAYDRWSGQLLIPRTLGKTRVGAGQVRA